MKRCWKFVLRVLVWGSLAAVIGLLVLSTKQTHSCASVCTLCLASQSGVERSLLGIPYEKKYQPIRYLYNTAEGVRFAKFSDGRQTIYEQIYGKTCEHEFARTARGRYRNGSVGCGGSGGSWELKGRNELVLGSFRAFERIRDNELAARSCELIELEFALDRPPRVGGQNQVKDAEEHAERYRRMSLMRELLGLVRNKEDWAAVLSYVKGGFQGDPPLLNDPAGLSERLQSGDPTIRQTAAFALAREPSTGEELMKKMFRHGDHEVLRIAGQSVFYGKRFPLFGASLRSIPLDEYQKKSMQVYAKGEFEALFSMNDPLINLTCLEAISKGDRFDLLEMALAALMRDPSDAGSLAIKRLLRGPNPFFENDDHDTDGIWNGIETIHAPIAELRVSIMTDIGPNRRERSKYNLMSAIKSIGTTHDVSQWKFLQEAYLHAIDGGTAEWWLACMAKAMHELDAPATERFLVAEIKDTNYERLSAAFSSMGLIGARNFEKPLNEFVAHPPEQSSIGVNVPKYYFFGDGYGARFLKYALHRCRGIPLWNLVKNTDGRYLIEKPSEISR